VLATARSLLDRLGLALGDAPEAEAAALPEPTPQPETVVFREGDDLSVLVVGPLLDTALEAVERVGQDVSAELVLLPADGAWDPETVFKSVAKTSKVVLVHQNSGDELRVAEVAAYIAEDVFHYLDAPVRRVQLPGADLVEQLQDLAEI
jgi:pyruvate/2-oxoglutarate/acetoin dehydrogenase E1 component